MKKRVKEAEKEAERRGENESVNKEYFYPKRLFREILREYKNKDLKPKEEGPSEVDLLLEEIRGDQSSLPGQEQTTQLANIQTPPLPNTPQPIVRPVQANVDPNTNLTRTETALLSPEEQVIASRT
jgi:hypothetical protein